MKKRDTIIYLVVTGIFSLMLAAGAITYFVSYETPYKMFTDLGVPTEIIYPLAIAKLLGIAAIWLIKNPLLKNLAYLGFALDFILAIIAHARVEDDGVFGPVIPLVLLIISYIYLRKTQSADNANG